MSDDLQDKNRSGSVSPREDGHEEAEDELVDEEDDESFWEVYHPNQRWNADGSHNQQGRARMMANRDTGYLLVKTMERYLTSL